MPCKGIPNIYIFLLFVKKVWLKSRFDIFFLRRGNVILIEFLINGTLMELKTILSYTLRMLSVMDIPRGNVKKTWLQSCFIFELFSLNFSFYDCQNVSYTKIKVSGDVPYKQIPKCLLF